MCGISSKDEPDWESLIFLAKLIPRMCHNINRYILQMAGEMSVCVCMKYNEKIYILKSLVNERLKGLIVCKR